MKYFFLSIVLLLFSCKKESVNPNTVIGIIPYANISTEKVNLIKNAVTDYYGLKVKILPQNELPKSAFVNIKSPRYRADSLIAQQLRIKPDSIDYIIGITDSDISTTKKDAEGNIKQPEWKYNDFGIMGLAYCPGKSCVVSTFRLKHTNKEVHFGRFKKVVIHELGHNFGLPHCLDKKCVMTDAVERISTIDNAKPELCDACKKKIY